MRFVGIAFSFLPDWKGGEDLLKRKVSTIMIYAKDKDNVVDRKRVLKQAMRSDLERGMRGAC
jgi:hypothetical protein